MMLLTKELRRKLPPLYATENTKDPLVICKFFFPSFHWKWYAIEFDGQDLFWGYVVGDACEIGYFSLVELTNARGPYGTTLERGSWLQAAASLRGKKAA